MFEIVSQVQARIDAEVAAESRNVVSQLLRNRMRQFRSQPTQQGPGVDTRLIACIHRVDLLPKLEIVGQIRVNALSAG